MILGEGYFIEFPVTKLLSVVKKPTSRGFKKAQFFAQQRNPSWQDSHTRWTVLVTEVENSLLHQVINKLHVPL